MIGFHTHPVPSQDWRAITRMCFNHSVSSPTGNMFRPVAPWLDRICPHHLILLILLVGQSGLAQDQAAQSHYAQGLSLFSGGQLGLAEQESSTAMNLAPTWAEPCLLLGRIYAAERKPQPAQEMFQKAISLKPDFAEAYLALGLLHLQQKDREKAVESLREAIRLQPQYALAHLSLANTYVSAGNFEDAIKEFQLTLDLVPQDSALSFFADYNLGSIYDRRKESAQALAYFEKARALKPGDREVLFALCGLYFKLKRDSEALAIEEELTKAVPLHGGDNIRLGLLLVENERYADALPLLEEAQREGVATFELFEALGTVYYNLTRYADAERALTRALEFDSKFPQTYFILAEAYAAQNDARAVEAFKKCLQLQPSREDAWEGLSRELARRKASDEAIEAFDRYAKSFPKEPLAHLLLGEAYFNKAQFLAALDEFQKAAGLAPTLGRAYYSMGFTYKTMGKFSEAKKYFQQALALDPHLSLAAYHLGAILGSEGDYEESHRLLNQAIDSNPDYADAYRKLGENYFRQKKYAEAEQYLKTAVRLQPDGAQAHFLLSRVYVASKRPELAKNEYEVFRSLSEKEAETSGASRLTYRK
jgi:protein O-GlcNAc transferase